jgi:hypothetical protein
MGRCVKFFNFEQEARSYLKNPNQASGPRRQTNSGVLEYWSIGVLVMKKAVVLSFFSPTSALQDTLPGVVFRMILNMYGN